jgi:hypothetical protein
VFGLDVRVIVPELIAASVDPALSALRPMYEASLANAHQEAELQGRKVAELLTA